LAAAAPGRRVTERSGKPSTATAAANSPTAGNRL